MQQTPLFFSIGRGPLRDRDLLLDASQLKLERYAALVMTLDELAATEARLEAEVRALTGTIDDKLRQLKDRGISARYAEVHAAYCDLAVAGDGEALKRAVFLQWYAVSDPAFCSGLLELDPKAEALAFARLSDLCATGGLDEEWTWMLPWYDAVSDFYFERRTDIPALQRWLTLHRSDVFPARAARSPSLAGRGQLSAYWYRPDAGSGVPRADRVTE